LENNVDRIAVLLMAYGAPNSLDEIEPYYTDIRGGRRPSTGVRGAEAPRARPPENLRQLVARYQRIGGRTPLLDITREQARALQTELGDRFRVYVGMKHWHPYIAAAVDEIARDGLRRVIALALAPHYSRLSIDGYVQRVRDAVLMSLMSRSLTPGHQGHQPLDVVYVESWNDHPLYLRAVAEKMQAARQAFGVNDWAEIEVVFSAHSLPERILPANDPYPRELRETCEGVAALVGLKGWRFAYQSSQLSRSSTPGHQPNEKWLGPDILEVLDEIAAEGHRRVLIAPIGFVADNLEILYDIDVECAERARTLGLEMRRTESLNASPLFVSALAAIVHEYSDQVDFRL
jgi:ferrochelatase